MTGESGPAPWAFNLFDEALGLRRVLAPGIETRIFPGERAMVSVVRFAPNAAGALHSHPEEQWGFLLEGACVRIQGDEALPMKAGDFWRTAGGVPHTIQAGPDGAVVLDVFSPPRPEYARPGQGFGDQGERRDGVQGDGAKQP